MEESSWDVEEEGVFPLEELEGNSTATNTTEKIYSIGHDFITKW